MEFQFVFEKYLLASDVCKSNKQCIIYPEEFAYFRTMLHPDDEQKLLEGKRIVFLAEDGNNLWRFYCKEADRNQGKLFGKWIKFVEANNIVENTRLRFEWAAAARQARLTFLLPTVYGGLQMVPNPIPIQAMGPNPNEESGSDSINSLTDLIDFENLEPENLELLEGVVNSPLNNEGEFLPPQSGAVNSLNQAVSFNTLGGADLPNMNESNARLNNEAGSGSFGGEFVSDPTFVPTQLGAVNSLNQAVSSNTQGGVDLVNMNERLTKRIKTMQGTIQDCLGVMAPCISNIHSETGKMAIALQELEKLLAPYDPSTDV